MGGLLFFLIFSVMNAGFYLYGANAMQYAADIGVATIAAEGNYDNTGDPAAEQRRHHRHLPDGYRWPEQHAAGHGDAGRHL